MTSCSLCLCATLAFGGPAMSHKARHGYTGTCCIITLGQPCSSVCCGYSMAEAICSRGSISDARILNKICGCVPGHLLSIQRWNPSHTPTFKSALSNREAERETTTESHPKAIPNWWIHRDGFVSLQERVSRNRRPIPIITIDKVKADRSWADQSELSHLLGRPPIRFHGWTQPHTDTSSMAY